MSCIDYGSYPHLFDSIVAYASHGTLLSLRATCSSLRKRVDETFAFHVVIPAAATRKEPGRLKTPTGKRIPLLLSCRGTSATAVIKNDPRTCNVWKTTRIVDREGDGVFDYSMFDQNQLALRFRGTVIWGAKAGLWSTSIGGEAKTCHPATVVITPTTKDCTWPAFVVSATSPQGPATEKLVINVVSPRCDIGRGCYARSHYRSTISPAIRIKHKVFVFQDPNAGGESPNHTTTCPRAVRELWSGVHYVLATLEPDEVCILVGLDRWTPELRLDSAKPWEVIEQDPEVTGTTLLSDVDGPRNTRFMSAAEYKAEVGDERFAFETQLHPSFAL